MAYTSKHGVDDMVMLTGVSDTAIRDNLRKRYTNDLIYTYIGHVLISVNPFRMIPGLYEMRTLMDYRGKYRYELAPHVYALADEAYRKLIGEGEKQCVIISGESGAGKTEASKKILQYIAAISGKGEEVQRIKNIILESNPLLEAFGNAKTIRNNNSSRFGKYMEIQFNLGGDPEGGRISNYLLEKSRVVTRAPTERCFHIFYQMIAGANAQEKKDFCIPDKPDFFRYLSLSKAYKVDGMDDVKWWEETRNAMNVIGIAPAEQAEIIKLVSAILWLGNIEFREDDKEAAQPTDPQTVETFGYLVGADPEACRNALCLRTIESGSSRRSIYKSRNNTPAAIYARDALAKALYTRMFDHIVMRINQAMYKKADEDITIGILDIYGFEIFEKNGFEQLCINYVNEKLQQIFIQLTLKQEQEEYAAEGIKWEPIPFFNNKVCCDLIESKRPIGILTLLDDVSNFPKGSDDKFHTKLGEQFTGHAHWSYGSGPREFIVKHYAGEVVYSADGFVDRNKDTLFPDLIELGAMSRSPFIVGLFPEATVKKTSNANKRPTTAGFKIKQSIGELVNALMQCNPHYIRCMKPNDNKRAKDYDNKRMLHQVKYLGLLENVRVRRAGYAYRQTYDKFFFRYRVLSDKTWPNFSGSHQAGAQAILMDALGFGPGKEFQEGKTKIFIRAPETVFSLEEQRERKVQNFANRIQRFFGRFALQQYYYDLAMTANNEVKGKKERRRLSLGGDPYVSDYVGYRDNFALKGIIESNGRERLLFADNVSKYDRRSREQRRVLVVTELAFYLIAIEKNKNKEKRAQFPYVYMCKRRVPLKSITGLLLSSCQDGFVTIKVGGQYDNLVDCRRKTELVGVLKKTNPSISVSISDVMNIILKGKGGKPGKSRKIQFVRNGAGGSGLIKGAKVTVAPGEGKDSSPSITAPPKMEHAPAQRAEIRITPKSRGAPASRPGPPAGGYGRSRPGPPAGGYGRSRPSPGGMARPGPPGRGRAPPGRGRAPPGRGRAPPGRGRARGRGRAPPGRGRARGRGRAPPGRGRARGRGRAPPGRGRAPPGRGRPSPGGSRCKAQYDFVPQQSDELAFKAGDIITIVDKSSADWWTGELRGKRGVFPSNYVAPM